MQRFQARGGYTLMELMVVVAIIGFVSMMAITTLKGYARREDTRRAAWAVAGVLENARSQAMTTGRMTWVVFGEPVNGVAKWEDPSQFAAVIWDKDNDLLPTAADDVQPIWLPPGPREHTSLYDPSMAPDPGVVLPDLDQSKDIPDGKLANTIDGTTFNVDVTLGVPAIGFSSQGYPVRVDKPLDYSGNPGAVYMSDNDRSVVAVVVLPIGAVKTLSLDTATDTWK